MRTCRAPGCRNAAAPGRSLCHRCRWAIRVGKAAALPPARRATGRPWCNGLGGYLRLWAPGHPLAGRGGMVYAHRAAAFDAWGPGPQRCRWCGAEARWEDGSLTVHHLDFDPGNNAPGNLAPACATCNAAHHERAWR